MILDKLTTVEMEWRVAAYFNYRQNIIVPNISWGAGLHECDLLIVTKRGIVTEVEIKVSRSDLKADAKKRHKHKNEKIKDLYFAIPDYMRDCIELIPEHAGIILVSRNYDRGDSIYCKTIREPVSNRNYIKMTDKEVLNIARLGTMRIWSLKRKIIDKNRRKRKPIIKTNRLQTSLHFCENSLQDSKE